MQQRKILVLLTLIFALLIMGGLAIYCTNSLSRSLNFDQGGILVLGEEEARVQLVLFEDFQCSHCQKFSEQILPQIQSHYIDSGKVRCTIVPLPLFSGSRALTNVVLTIFENTPDKISPFLTQSFKLFPKTKVTNKALLTVTEQVGGIDLKRIEHCIQARCHYTAIDNNFKKSRGVMKKNVLVPTLYIDGIMTLTDSFQIISVEIEKALALKDM